MKKMSIVDEIKEVYEEDIEKLSEKVTIKHGPLVFYDGMKEMGFIQNIWPEEFIDICEAIWRADLDIAPASSEA